MSVLAVMNFDQTRSYGKRCSTALALAIALAVSPAHSDDFGHRRQYLPDMLSDPAIFPVRHDYSTANGEPFALKDYATYDSLFAKSRWDEGVVEFSINGKSLYLDARDLAHPIRRERPEH